MEKSQFRIDWPIIVKMKQNTIHNIIDNEKSINTMNYTFLS